MRSELSPQTRLLWSSIGNDGVVESMTAGPVIDVEAEPEVEVENERDDD